MQFWSPDSLLHPNWVHQIFFHSQSGSSIQYLPELAGLAYQALKTGRTQFTELKPKTKIADLL